MRENDRIRVRHMLEATQAQAFVADKVRSDLDVDALLLHGLVRNIEIIGEAASRVSHELQEFEEEVPWADMIGMRNRLVHVYFDVDKNRVWNTVQHDLPPLIVVLERMLAR